MENKSLTHIPEEVAETLSFAGNDIEAGCIYVAKQFVDKHRWYNNYLIVFEHGGTHYGFTYMEPATEYQEGQDTFNTNAAGSVPVWEVVPKEVTVTEWHKP